MARRSAPLLRSLLLTPRRTVTYMPRPGDGAPRTVTLIPGDGIVTGAVRQAMEAMRAPVCFETCEVYGEAVESIRRNKVCLKGPVAYSIDTQLCRDLDLYASVLSCSSLPGPLPAAKDCSNVDIVVVRENSQGGGHVAMPIIAETLKDHARSCAWKEVVRNALTHPQDFEVLTKFCSERIAKYSFEYAYLNNRKKVTAVHDTTHGLFLESCREVATNYPGIQYNEITVGDCCMQQLVSKPEQFDVMVVPNNMYGSVVSNLAACIAGGHSIIPGGNVGPDYAVFKQGAPAGNAGDNKIVEQKKANPVPLLISSAMMLRHLQLPSFADRLETAVKCVIAEGKYRTEDLGVSTTQEVMDAVISKLD